jgi:hypothetical protein
MPKNELILSPSQEAGPPEEGQVGPWSDLGALSSSPRSPTQLDPR